MSVLPPSKIGNPIFGKYAHALAHGGTFTKCDCSAVQYYDHDGNGGGKAALKGRGCWHTSARLMYMFHVAGWTHDDARTVALNTDHKGFVWMHAQRDPGEAFEGMWEKTSVSHSEAMTYGEGALTPEQPKKPSKRRTKRLKSGFVYHDAVMNDLLDVIDADPGVTVRGIQRVLVTRGWWRGHVDMYLAKAIERGLVRFDVGPRNAHCHFVVMRPDARRASFVSADVQGAQDQHSEPHESKESSPHDEESSNYKEVTIGTVAKSAIGTVEDAPADAIGTVADDEPLTVKILEKTIHCETPEEYAAWMSARDDLLAFLDPERNEPLPASAHALMTEWKSTGRW